MTASVMDIQKALISLGYKHTVGTADGVMGQKTKNAIFLFQKARGIKPTGTMDVLTEAALFGKTARANTTEIQKKLASHGYNVGPADGIWGKKTSAALLEFQSQHGLTANGVLDAETLEALDGTETNVNAAVAAHGYESVSTFQKTQGLPVTGVADEQTKTAIYAQVASKKYTVVDIQKRLNSLGYNVGVADGIAGKNTRAGLRAFQKENGITVSGTSDEQTLSYLFSKAAKRYSPSELPNLPWIAEGIRQIGLNEVRDHRKLMKWLRSDGGTVGDPAKISWCGDFVQTCIALTLPREPIPTNPYLALNWCKFGTFVTPQYGCILSFWRGSPASWKGHVGFYIGETADSYLVLGGNQSNMVCKSFVKKSRLRQGGSRWPTTVSPSGLAVQVSAKGYITTTNEA